MAATNVDSLSAHLVDIYTLTLGYCMCCFFEGPKSTRLFPSSINCIHKTEKPIMINDNDCGSTWAGAVLIITSNSTQMLAFSCIVRSVCYDTWSKITAKR